MRVLGVDPGVARTGVAVVDGEVGALRLAHVSCLETPSGMSEPDRLAMLMRLAVDVIERHRPDAAAVEQLFFATNRRSAMRVSQARGVLLCALAEAGVPVAEYTPLQVKEAVAGWGAAGKAQVARMSRALLGTPVIEGPDDATDACAVAVCHHHRARLAARASRGVAGSRSQGMPPALAAAVAAAQRRLGTGRVAR